VARTFAQRSSFAQSSHVRFSSARRRLTAATLAATALVVTPLLLFAHARLLRSTPAAHSRLDSAPTSLSLWFSERPELRFTSIQLLDSAGASIPLGTLAALTAEPPGVTAPIASRMINGRYTVVWRTAAADGHPTSGRYTFEVASAARDVTAATPAVAPMAPAPADTQVTNPVLAPDRVVTFSTGVRWAELVSVITIVGAVIFGLIVLPVSGWSGELFDEAAERARRLAQSALILFVITTVMRLMNQSALVARTSATRGSLAKTVIQDTRWGHGWLIGAIGAIVVAAGLLAARWSLRTGWLVAAFGVVAVCTSDGLTGHSGASRHLIVAAGADLAHYLAAGGWIGGLVAILLCGLPSLKVIDAAGRQGAGARLVRAYHRTALECVTLVVLSALVAAWLRLGSMGQLVTTDYGRILLTKVAFVVVLLLFGWFHWRRVVSVDWNADTKFRFQRSAAAELVVGALVIAVTAILVSTPLPE
jgi:putative copper export protein/methionine-rich copper-binding protein CopC